MNFFKIRFPDTLEIKGCSRRIQPCSLGQGQEGFLFSRFEENPEIMIIPKDSADFTDKEADSWTMANDLSANAGSPGESTSREEHSSMIEEMKRRMADWKEGLPEGRKAIVARRLVGQCNMIPTELFNRLCLAYPNACVFLFSTPETGTWIGASPETILGADSSGISTMSLAGTRWADDPEAPWDRKNIEEQRIVTDFILEVLKGENIAYQTIGPQSLKAGPVEHLATFIHSAKEAGCKRDPGLGLKLLGKLCPTPALSGYPRNEAIRAIGEIEREDRELYGGLVGYACADGSIRSYANLRSGRIFPACSKIRLYAGGGITLLSEPQMEWEETERKLSTIRQYL